MSKSATPLQLFPHNMPIYCKNICPLCDSLITMQGFITVMSYAVHFICHVVCVVLWGICNDGDDDEDVMISLLHDKE